MVKRGEVWLAVLDPTVGREIRKTRPCLVVSPDELNRHLATALVAPLTTGSRPTPYRVPINFQGKAGLVLSDQMRSLDRARLVKLLGKVDAATLRAVLDVLTALFEA